MRKAHSSASFIRFSVTEGTKERDAMACVTQQRSDDCREKKMFIPPDLVVWQRTVQNVKMF
jgi:hypothetical protein